jgi:hypothetical protein
MNDRYMVISPDTLEAMRRAGHAAKLEVRIEKLEAALREIVSLHHDHGAKAAEDIYIRDGMTFDIASKALEEKDD